MFSKLKQNRMAVGIGIGRNHIAAVEIDKIDNFCIIHDHSVFSEINYSENQGLSVFKRQLDEILQSVNQWIGKRYVTVRMAIDDPGMYTHSLRFESLPRKTDAQKELVSWQMEKALKLKSESLVVAFCGNQDVGRENTVFVSAIRKDMFNVINEAFSSVGILAESVMITSQYALSNMNRDVSQHEIHIFMHLDYVSIVFCNSNNVPIYNRSFWRIYDDDSENIMDDILDIERAVHIITSVHMESELKQIVIHSSSEIDKVTLKKHFKYIELTDFFRMDSSWKAVGSSQQLDVDSHYYSAINAAIT